ncbi:hypothetical protein [Bdellovibrio reynosensis]|uniref:Lysine-specific metallo-endopeptidase domain-containing protein n=1 Tax=Bdellovibrio reynosensis TaxID=2835041 RepID=A0ABY4C786_9BACT|nr:hypothetical protein [Bdellovibrio reynosensis]UOF00833.1 hypothetical protein MNR06_14120 [Bdellovibrio reynosensis]
MATSKDLLTISVLFSLSTPANAGTHVSRIAQYRTISNDTGIALTINTKLRSAVLRKNNGYLRLFFVDDTPVYTFVSDKKRDSYTFFYKKKNAELSVNFIREPNEELYSDNCNAENKIDRLAKNIDAIATFEGIEDSPSLGRAMLDVSCKEKLVPTEQLKIKTIAAGLFKGDSYLAKCLSDKSAQDKFSKIKNFDEDLELIVNEMANSQNLAKQMKAPVLISCEDSQIPSAFNAKFINGTITLPVSEKKFLKNECMTTDAILSHELLHKAGVKDEKRVAIFDAICASVSNPEAVENKSCEKQYTMKRCIKMPNDCGGIPTQLAVKNTIKSAKEQEHKKAAAVAKKEVEKAPIKEVTLTEKDWQALESPVDTPESTAATRSIASTMSSNFDSFAGAVNRTIGIIESPAYAASAKGDTSTSSSNISAPSINTAAASLETSKSTSGIGSKSKASDSTDDDTYYTTEEYLADKYPVAKTRSVASASNEPKAGSSFEVNASAGAKSPDGSSSAETAGAVLARGTLAKNGEIAEPSQRSMPSASGASGTSLNSSLNYSSPAMRPAGNRTPNEFKTSVPITTLQRNDTITGQEYKEITASYDNPQFSKDLRNEGVSITLSQEGSNLGQVPSKASLRFVDDGQSLKRVKGK